MTDDREVLRLLTESGALIRHSHVVLTSGKHSRTYINVKAVLDSEEALTVFASMIAARYNDTPIDIVVGPETGGKKLAIAVAQELSFLTKREIAAVTAQKHPTDKKEFYFENPSEVKEKSVLVVDDVLSTGGSVAHTVQLILESEGTVFAVAAVVNRGHVSEFDVMSPRLTCLLMLDTETWDEDECVISGPCSEGVPIDTRVGHGVSFLRDREEAGMWR